MVKVRLTEAQLRRIIREELADHYLVQKELWSDDRKEGDPTQSRSDQMNKVRRSA